MFGDNQYFQWQWRFKMHNNSVKQNSLQNKKHKWNVIRQRLFQQITNTLFGVYLVRFYPFKKNVGKCKTLVEWNNTDFMKYAEWERNTVYSFQAEAIQLEIHLDNEHHVQQNVGWELTDQMKHVIPYITLMIPLLLHNEAWISQDVLMSHCCQIRTAFV